MQSDITGIISKLNSKPQKIAVKLDTTATKNNFKADILSILSQMSSQKQYKLTISNVGIAPEAKQNIRKELDAISKATGKAMFDDGQSTSTLSQIANELRTISSLVSEINRKDFNITNTISGNAITKSLGGAKEELRLYKDYATEMINLNGKLIDSMSSINSHTLSQATRNAGGGNMSAVLQQMYNFKGVDAYIEQIGGANSISKIQSVIATLENYYSTFSAIVSQAHALDTTVAVPDTSGLDNAMSRISEYQTAQQQAITSMIGGAKAGSDVAVSSLQKTASAATEAGSALSNVKLDINAESLISKIDMIIDELVKLNNTFSSVGANTTESSEKAASAMDKVSSSMSRMSSSSKGDIAQQYKDASKAIKEYYSALAQLNKSNSDVIMTDNGWKSVSGNYNELASTLNRTKTAFDLVSNSMHSMPVEQQVQLQALLTSETNKYNMSVEQQANRERIAAEAAATRAQRQREAAEAAERTARSNELLAIGTDRQADALQKVNTLLNQVKLNTAKWTAADGGRSNEAYQVYKRQSIALEGLVRQLQTGTMSASQFSAQYRKIKSTVAESATDIKIAGENTQSWSDRIGTLTSRFTTWFGMTRIIMAAIRTCRQMVQASMEIEDSMAQLKIVTGSTDSQMEAFLTKATALAKELGQSISDVSKSIETFSRLGYNLGDASELAKYATILSNTASVDTDTATTGLTSIIKGYNMDVSQAEHVADVLVKVGQEYAISAEELMAAFQRGGAALYASGTDFEKSAALFAATNASLQNAEAVGTMWKTVSARIRGATTELQEMGESTEGLADGLSKYREEIKALSGVDIMKDEDTYKDMYDIFVELAEVWDKMSGDEARSRVAEILGGTRQLSGIMSTITNIKDAMGAYEGAMKAAGTAAQANNIYMDTTSAHVKQLQASFQELSADFMSSDFLEGSVDILRSIVEILDFIIARFGTLATVIGTVSVVQLIRNFGSSNEFALYGCESIVA